MVAPRAGPHLVPGAEKALCEIIRQLCAAALGQVERGCRQPIWVGTLALSGSPCCPSGSVCAGDDTQLAGGGLRGRARCWALKDSNMKSCRLFSLARKNKPFPHSVTLSPASHA